MNVDVNTTALSEIQGGQWNLTEVKNKSAAINIVRTGSPKDIYTIKFDAGHLTGTGAVNFYSAAYAACTDHSISILRFASIRDNTLYEMENFTEYEYFRHLERANRWYLGNGKLELHTYDEKGISAILIFSRN